MFYKYLRHFEEGIVNMSSADIMYHLFALSMLISILSAASMEKLHVHRPRGVHLSRKSLYDSTKDFVCLDGSKSMPFEHVNDDYCDCSDGSDEPGTSACPAGSFACANLGYRSTNIPSSRVNDQLCDCCDGSDEYLGLIQCPDICDEIGKKEREELERRASITKEGFAKRQEMAKEGVKMRQEMKTKLDQMKEHRDSIDPIRDDLEIKKQEVEKLEKEAKDKHMQAWREQKEENKRKEASEAFNELDVDSDAKVTLAEMKMRREFDTDFNGEVTDQEAKDYLGGREESELQHFIDEVWMNIRHIYKLPTASESITESTIEISNDNEAKNVPLAVTLAPPITRNEQEGQKEILEQEDEDETREDEEEIEGDQVDDFDEEKSGGQSNEVESANMTDSDGDRMPDYDNDTQKLIDAAEVIRKEYKDIDDKLKQVESDIKSTEEMLEMDLGNESEWLPLRHKCFEMTNNEYTYKICLFDKCSQKDKAGYAEVILGNWGEWHGSEDALYSRQKYTNGQSCWNGPERSAEVILRCGVETALMAASEPSRCEYLFVVHTPAVCQNPVLIQHQQLHSEL